MDSFESIIGYVFHNPSLLKASLVHPSFKKKAKDFERLEFLGDRVLGIVIAEWLYADFPLEPEGDLARRLASLVRKESCEWVGNQISINQFLQISKSDVTGYTAIFADAVEALIGAIFLDGGLEKARNFVRRFWSPLLDHCKRPPKDPKSSLQEWAQSKNKPIPFYELMKTSGPAHSPHFFVRVHVEDYPPLEGEGDTKRLAEHDAALRFLNILKKDKHKKSK